LIILI